MEHLTFHHDGKEYIVYDVLTAEVIETMKSMGEERYRKLDPLSAKSTKKYFEDTDKMVETILRRCFHMTDIRLDQLGRRKLVHAFIRFLEVANKLDC